MTRLSRLVALTLRIPEPSSGMAGRGEARDRRAITSTIAAVAARAIGLGTVLISVPLTLGYLGAERYGLWMTITALVAILSFADLGIGNGLLNAVAARFGHHDLHGAQQDISSAVALLSAVAVAIATIFLLVYPVIPWAAIFNVSTPLAVAESGPAVAVFLVCYLVGMPLSVVSQTRAGLQEAYLNSAFVAAGNIAGFLGLLGAVSAGLGLPWLVLALAGGPILAAIANGAHLFAISHPELRLSRHAVTVANARQLVGIGALFLVLQMAVAVAYASDTLILAQLIGPVAVTDYAVVTRLFLVPTVILMLWLTPLWPAYREAIVAGDIAWVERRLFASIRGVVVFGVPVVLVLIISSRPFLDAWVGEGVRPAFALILGVGVWTVIGGLGNALAMLLNGAQVVRIQVACAVVMAVANITLSIWLTSHFGESGVIWGTIISYTLLSLIPIAAYVPRLLSRLRGGLIPS